MGRYVSYTLFPSPFRFGAGDIAKSHWQEWMPHAYRFRHALFGLHSEGLEFLLELCAGAGKSRFRAPCTICGHSCRLQ